MNIPAALSVNPKYQEVLASNAILSGGAGDPELRWCSSTGARADALRECGKLGCVCNVFSSGFSETAAGY